MKINKIIVILGVFVSIIGYYLTTINVKVPAMWRVVLMYNMVHPHQALGYVKQFW